MGVIGIVDAVIGGNVAPASTGTSVALPRSIGAAAGRRPPPPRADPDRDHRHLPRHLAMRCFGWELTGSDTAAPPDWVIREGMGSTARVVRPR